MSGVIGSGVTLRGLIDQDARYTWLLSGGVLATDVGKAAAQDTNSANTAKLAGDGDTLLGRLSSVQVRVQEGITTGVIDHEGGFQFDYTGTVALGDQVVGSATAGKVKAAPTVSQVDATPTPDEVAIPAPNRTLVVEVDSVAHTCVVLFM